jgi:hypothetical protein
MIQTTLTKPPSVITIAIHLSFHLIGDISLFQSLMRQTTKLYIKKHIHGRENENRK